jgi:hypothetical protein
MSTCPSVYVAHPMTGYGSAHAAACIEAPADLLPSANLTDPAMVYAGDAEWHAQGTCFTVGPWAGRFTRRPMAFACLCCKDQFRSRSMTFFE